MAQRRNKIGRPVQLDNLLRIYGTKIPTYLTAKLDAIDFKEFRRSLTKQQLRIAGVDGPAALAAAKRRANDLLRPHVKARKQSSDHIYPKRLLAGKFRTCPIMNELVPDREKKWTTPIKRRKHAEITFEKFSFLDDPAGTIQKLHELTTIEASALSLKIDFNDPYCLDVAPYLLLGVIRQSMLPIIKGGLMAQSVMKVVDAVGLRHFLEMSPFKSIKNKHDVWAFPMQQKNVPTNKILADLAVEPTSKEKIQDLLVAKINEWLFQVGHEFTGEGRGWLSTMTGEALDNAERHSDPVNGNGNWTIAGFMARRKDNNCSQLVCHLTIMSIGASIGETIELTPITERDKIEAYCDNHSRGLKKKPYSRETLRTVCALQDGVSRFAQGEGRVSGGTGIMEFVGVMNELGDSPLAMTKPQLTIISGKSCIMFKDIYANGVSAGKNEPRMQWFNPQNSLDYPPDHHYVFDLPHKLSGTIVSMRFSLDEEYLQKKVGADD